MLNQIGNENSILKNDWKLQKKMQFLMMYPKYCLWRVKIPIEHFRPRRYLCSHMIHRFKYSNRPFFNCFCFFALRKEMREQQNKKKTHPHSRLPSRLPVFSGKKVYVLCTFNFSLRLYLDFLF